MWSRLGSLRWGLRHGFDSGFGSAGPANLVTLTAQKFLDLPFSKEGSHEMVSRRPPNLCPFYVAGVGLSGHFVLLNDRCRASAAFSFAWQVWRFLQVANTLAVMSRNQRCLQRQFFVAGVVFGDFGGRVKASQVLFCEIVVIGVWETMLMMIVCGTRLPLLCSFFLAGAVLQRPRQKVAETKVQPKNIVLTTLVSGRSRCGAAISARDLLARSLQEISMQGLCARSL